MQFVAPHVARASTNYRRGGGGPRCPGTRPIEIEFRAGFQATGLAALYILLASVFFVRVYR